MGGTTILLVAKTHSFYSGGFTIQE